MSDTSTTTRDDLLEQLADTLAAGSAERDYGIAWAVGRRPDLRSLLPDDPETVKGSKSRVMLLGARIRG